MQLAKDDNIEGVYGPLIELITVDEKFHTAVEVTAGNRYGTLASGRETASRSNFSQLVLYAACSMWWLTVTRPHRAS